VPYDLQEREVIGLRKKLLGLVRDVRPLARIKDPFLINPVEDLGGAKRRKTFLSEKGFQLIIGEVKKGWFHTGPISTGRHED
jgi:hypothetical protein